MPEAVAETLVLSRVLVRVVGKGVIVPEAITSTLTVQIPDTEPTLAGMMALLNVII
jgi:hypothetical protein